MGKPHFREFFYVYSFLWLWLFLAVLLAQVHEQIVLATLCGPAVLFVFIKTWLYPEVDWS